MKRFLNAALLVCWALMLGYGVFAFGGAAREYVLPFYLLGATLAGLWAAKLLLCRPVSWVWSPMHVPVLLFAAYTVIRYFTSPVEYDARTELLHILLFTVVYFVASANFYRQRDRTILVWILAGVAFASAVYGFWQFATKTDAVLWFTRPAQYRGRASGTYICPNHLAGLLEMAFAVLLGRLVVNRLPSRSLQKTFLIKLGELYMLLFVLAGLYATQSRGGWVATALAIIGALLWMWRAKALHPRIVDTALLLIVVGGIAALSVPSARTRLQQTFTLNLDYTFDYDVLEVKDETWSDRLGLNQGTKRIIGEHPVFGSGPGTWRWIFPQHRDARILYTPRYAHNDVLELTAEYGFIGLALALGVLGCFLWQVVRFTRPAVAAEERAWMIGAVTAITAIGFHSFTDFNLHIPVNAFIVASLLGLTAAISGKERHFLRLEARPPARTVAGIALAAVTVVLLWLSIPLCLAHRQAMAGDDALAAGEWNIAIEHYRRAAKLDARSPLAQVRLGDAFRRQNADPTAPLRADESRALLDNAVRAYERSLVLNPLDSGVWFRLAVVREGQNEIELARAAYERAVTLDPLNPALLLRAGRFDVRTGLLVRGTELLERSAKLGNAAAKEALAKLRAQKPATPAR